MSVTSHNQVCINDFAIACAIDGSPPYFTYDEETMLIINSEEYEKHKMSRFLKIEPYMEALISHESIHVVIKRLVDQATSDELDDLENDLDRRHLGGVVGCRHES